MREIVLAGRPNSGKSTLFNRLANANQKVANYSGCTVEKKTALCQMPDGLSFELSDIPGIYSLKANTPDESVALKHLEEVGERAIIVLVVDGNNLREELILPLLLKGRGYSIVIAINMIDEVRASKMLLDHHGMAALAGVPLFPISAKTGEGVDELKRFLGKLSHQESASQKVQPLTSLANAEIMELFQQAKEQATNVHAANPLANKASPLVMDERTARNIRIDKWLVHPFFGPLLFFVFMFILFQSVFSWSAPLSDLLEAGIGNIQNFLKSQGDALWISLLADGILGGVGAVVVFVPPIALLFFLIGIFELSGYLPRAAYMVDRLLKPYGLEGKVFIPLLSSVACAVPGIMATRTIENERTRIITIMISPLMTCSARLPVYTLLIASFIPNKSIFGLQMQGLAMFLLYALGVVMALIVALILQSLNLSKRKATIDFIHLPSYRWPDWHTLVRYVMNRVFAFMKKAGTVIAAMAIIIWFLLSFPHDKSPQSAQPENILASQALQNSYGGKLGHFLEPVFAPIGFDWKLTIGVVASLAAREVFVSTLGTVFALEDPESTEALGASLQAAKKADGSPAYTLATCMSLLVFFAFSLQCISTIGIAAKETASWRIPLVMFLYMFVLAYGSAFIAYRAFLPWS